MLLKVHFVEGHRSTLASRISAWSFYALAATTDSPS